MTTVSFDSPLLLRFFFFFFFFRFWFGTALDDSSLWIAIGLCENNHLLLSFSSRLGSFLPAFEPCLLGCTRMR
ncbi:uncharacterized protein J3D65DRAFT_66598 [Phyllosticta citribraziliensis]|uniref:Secreted protein n=1 Tax=Phyllosticta citribraziliensis TaxID=989973 RepID=A0ABR1LEC5_9PEZI